jgi:hypothetical protein
MDVVDVTPVEAKVINLDEELGIPAPEKTPLNAEFDEISSKNAENGGKN